MCFQLNKDNIYKSCNLNEFILCESMRGPFTILFDGDPIYGTNIEHITI